MNSQNDDQEARIEKYLQVFNDFIISYHSGSSPEDIAIVKHWQAFKKASEKSPYDINALETYLNSKFGPQNIVSTNTKKKSTKSVQSAKIAKDILKQMKKTNNDLSKTFKP